jgi:hypothetical protein
MDAGRRASTGASAPTRTSSLRYGAVGVALRCTRCGATSVSSLFYLGTDAHVCRICNAPFELADPGRDRRRGRDRRTRGNGVDGWAEWRSGADRRGATPT